MFFSANKFLLSDKGMDASFGDANTECESNFIHYISQHLQSSHKSCFLYLAIEELKKKFSSNEIYDYFMMDGIFDLADRRLIKRMLKILFG